MKAEIVAVGDELLIGQVVNTNAAWIGEQLTAIGIDVVRHHVVGDDLDAIESMLRTACEAADAVVVSGGLGSTPDDLTIEAVARLTRRRLVFNEELWDRVESLFNRRGRPVPETARRQCMIPEGAELLPNRKGLAPGFWVEAEVLGGILVVLPGVPHEMQTMLSEQVLPRLAQSGGRRTIRIKTLHTAGAGESDLHSRLHGLESVLGVDAAVAFLPSSKGVRLRLTVAGESHSVVDQRMAELESFVDRHIGRFIYARDGRSLEQVVGQLLSEKGLTVAVAESCTGGLVMSLLTDVPGSSAYTLGGIVAYCNSVKERQLRVSPETIAQEGAVSEAVALEMARGVRAELGADVGLAVTGIMGPEGGTPDKPVGTLWVSLVDGQGESARHVRLVGDRKGNTRRAATAALNLLRLRLQDL